MRVHRYLVSHGVLPEAHQRVLDRFCERHGLRCEKWLTERDIRRLGTPAKVEIPPAILPRNTVDLTIRPVKADDGTGGAGNMHPFDVAATMETMRCTKRVLPQSAMVLSQGVWREVFTDILTSEEHRRVLLPSSVWVTQQDSDVMRLQFMDPVPPPITLRGVAFGMPVWNVDQMVSPEAVLHRAGQCDMPPALPIQSFSNKEHSAPACPATNPWEKAFVSGMDEKPPSTTTEVVSFADLTEDSQKALWRPNLNDKVVYYFRKGQWSRLPAWTPMATALRKLGERRGDGLLFLENKDLEKYGAVKKQGTRECVVKALVSTHRKVTEEEIMNM